MDDLRFGRAIRATRVRRGWRQLDLANTAQVSKATIARVESGRLDELTIATVRRVARALEVGLELLPRSRGAELDRILNAKHSALAEATTRSLGSEQGWVVLPEVSFSIWGERGVVDALAWHGASRSVVVIELKTAIVDVGEIIGTLDRKRRLAVEIAGAQGWNASTVSVALLVAEGSTNRRRIQEHAETFRAALPGDARQWRRWLRRPEAAMRALVFVSDVRPGNRRSDFSTVQRVRRRPVAPTRGSAHTSAVLRGEAWPSRSVTAVVTVPRAEI